MLVLKCNIQITSKDSGKKVTFNYVKDVNITTSIQDLTDTATSQRVSTPLPEGVYIVSTDKKHQKVVVQ